MVSSSASRVAGAPSRVSDVAPALAPARRALVHLHRWLGLGTAAFLFFAGSTGAVIAFEHELDGALNPDLYVAAPSASAPRDALVLADQLESTEPRVRVTWLPLAVEPGETLQVFTAPRLDPVSGAPFDVGFDQVALHPATGTIQAARRWGAVTLRPEGLLPFLYRFHHTLSLPDAGGLPVGALWMGIVAIAWTIDCFVSLLVAFPNPARWRRSFPFGWRAGGRRLLFDLHRSGGVWIWGLLLALAVTSVSMNLGDTVVRPLVGQLSPLTPDPLAQRRSAPLPTPPVDRRGAVDIATAEAAARGWTAPPGGLFYSAEAGRYAVGFYGPGDDHGDGGLGNPWLYVDGETGAVVGARVPGEGSAGDVFLQAQFPIHSGRILGLGGRIVVALMGVAVAVLSVTGVLLWARRTLRRGLAARSGGVA